MIELKGKNALVTGSSRGVGQQVALGLAKLGCNIIVHGRNKNSCTKTLDILKALNINTYCVFGELSDENQRVVDILMKYDGPNNDGLTVMEALENKISEEYPNDKIFDHKKPIVDLTVTNVNSKEYQVNFDFEYHKGEMNYDWNVNIESEEIIPNNSEGKYIIELVNYYD